jgi:cell shape-determining protein MreC
MSSFNQRSYKKRKTLFQSMIGIGSILLGVVIVWVIVRAIVGTTVSNLPLGSTTTIYNTLLPKKVLVKKITELQTTLESYDAQLTTAKILSNENEALKAELGRSPRPTGVLAHVVTLPNRSFYDTFVIDAGSRDAVSVGQVAYGFGSIALGTITSVESDHATVQLFSASGQTTSGTVAGSDLAVTLIGRGGGEYEVRMPRDVEFVVGGLIAYQSVQSAVLAQIERIVTDPRDPFQRLIAKAPINLQALKWVIVR